MARGIVVATFSVALLLAACGGGQGDPQTSPTPAGSPAPGNGSNGDGRGGTLTVGLAGEFSSLDPNYQMIVPSQSLYEVLFERLVRVNPLTSEIEPALATEWTQVDENTWEFTIREGVEFHNGATFTVQDAVGTIQRIMDEETPGTIKSRIANVESVEAVDDRTLRITTASPDVVFLGNIGEVRMYPFDYYEEVGQEGFNAEPIGTGPYRLVSWDRGGAVTVEAFDDYWGDPPLLDQVVFRTIPEALGRVAALEAGEIDIAYNISPDEAARLEQEDFIAASVPNGQGTGVQLFGRPGTGDPLLDPRVRQALNYAIDKEAIVENIMLGYTAVLNGTVVGPDAFGYNPDLDPWPYDPDRARELLAEAGYPDGFTIDFDAGVENYTKGQEVAEAVVAQLAEVGVTANLQVLEWTVYVEKLARTYDSAPLTYVGWNYYPVMDADFAIRHFVSSSPYFTENNEMEVSPEMDELYAQQKTEFDRDARISILHEFMAEMREEAQMIYLFQSPLINGVSPRVQGYQPTPNDLIDIRGVTVTD
jgi:peptide/nickel transport system substrate-binding protein